MACVTIIGAGITGLATAYFIHRNSPGRQCRIVEKSARPGGKIITERTGSFIVEGGPDSFITRKPWALNLCRDLGLADSLLAVHQRAGKLNLSVNDTLHPLPDGLRLGVPTRFLTLLASPVISSAIKTKMVREYMHPPESGPEDESLADFVERHFGLEALHLIFEPLLAGIYAAKPDRMSVAATFPLLIELEHAYGSIIRGMRTERTAARNQDGTTPMPLFVSLRNGMGDLIDTLCKSLPVSISYNETVKAVEQVDGQFHVVTSSGSHITDAVVVTIPAMRAGPILRGVDAQLAAELSSIRYASTATVSLVYDAADCDYMLSHEGTGYLTPRTPDRIVTGCSWSSRKFSHRAPAGKLLLRAFIGGDGMDSILDAPNSEIIRHADAELRRSLRISGNSEYQRLFRWHNGSPQYDLGHIDRVRRVEQRVSCTPGLYVVGNAYRGVGIGDCIHDAYRTAEAIALYPKKFRPESTKESEPEAWEVGD